MAATVRMALGVSGGGDGGEIYDGAVAIQIYIYCQFYIFYFTRRDTTMKEPARYYSRRCANPRP